MCAVRGLNRPSLHMFIPPVKHLDRVGLYLSPLARWSANPRAVGRVPLHSALLQWQLRWWRHCWRRCWRGPCLRAADASVIMWLQPRRLCCRWEGLSSKPGAALLFRDVNPPLLGRDRLTRSRIVKRLPSLLPTANLRQSAPHAPSPGVATTVHPRALR